MLQGAVRRIHCRTEETRPAETQEQTGKLTPELTAVEAPLDPLLRSQQGARAGLCVKDHPVQPNQCLATPQPSQGKEVEKKPRWQPEAVR